MSELIICPRCGYPMSENFGGWSIDIELFECIRKLLPEGSTLLELGSGSSTNELSKFYKMISIENDEKYINKYNSDYIHAPLRTVKPTRHFTECTQWYNAEAIEAGLKGKHYDMILVDGPPSSSHTRPVLYKYKNLFNWNVPVIFDDTNNHDVWRLIVIFQRYLKQHAALTLNMDKRKCFTILHPDKEALKGLL